jgi:hypothetical protein
MKNFLQCIGLPEILIILIVLITPFILVVINTSKKIRKIRENDRNPPR